MTVLLWIAVLIGIWCVASVGAAIALGTFLRHRHEATDSTGALRPLDTGPLRLWIGEFPDVPDVPDDIADLDGADLDERRGAPSADDSAARGAGGLPGPRTSEHDRSTAPAAR